MGDIVEADVLDWRPPRTYPTPWEMFNRDPHGWDQRPCGYLQFSDIYDDQAERARQRGWLVRRLPGQHLHQLVDPAAVAGQLLDMIVDLHALPA